MNADENNNFSAAKMVKSGVIIGMSPVWEKGNAKEFVESRRPQDKPLIISKSFSAEKLFRITHFNKLYKRSLCL